MSVFRTMCGALVLVGGWCSTAGATMTRVLTYQIHEDPYVASSPVAFTVSMTLQAAASSGSSIGWEIQEIRIEQANNPDGVWIEALPAVHTEDGLWWVRHGDALVPGSADFTKTPHLQGTAAALSPGMADLDYLFEGDVYPDAPVYPVTAALTYDFTLVGSDQPLAAGAGEPVEVDPLGW